MELAELENWQRLGVFVREARIALGYTNRENFAEVARISVRVLADLEAGTRTNFSNRVLADLEEGLGWPGGTIDQIVSDSSFEPPNPGTGGGDLLFRAPIFNRRPVPVDVKDIERSIIALTEVHRSPATKPSPVDAALVAQCWPYIVRLVEDNCLPGRELHPAVRPIYEAFAELATWAIPNDSIGRYVQWLVGDAVDVAETGRQRYMQRWLESRRAVRGRRTAEQQVEVDAAST